MNDTLPKKHINCPNCGTELNGHEIADQECYTCGWPEPWESEIDDETQD